MSGRFELNDQEAQELMAAISADIADARAYSTPRNPEFSQWDAREYRDPQAICEQLMNCPEDAAKLAELPALRESDLGYRLATYARSRRCQINHQSYFNFMMG